LFVLVLTVSPSLEKNGRDMVAEGTSHDPILELIDDPEAGLALVSKGQAGEAPEQERERLFWQFQFLAMRDWQAGDVLAVGKAVTDCMLFSRAPPFWLAKAVTKLGVQCMSDGEKRDRGAMNRHWLRWKAVKLVLGRHPYDQHNFKTEVTGDDVWVEAAKLVAGTDAECDFETVRKSYYLIEHAGGTQATLPTYKREVELRDHLGDQRRKKR
jgi:hypothetical protein